MGRAARARAAQGRDRGARGRRGAQSAGLEAARRAVPRHDGGSVTARRGLRLCRCGRVGRGGRDTLEAWRLGRWHAESPDLTERRDGRAGVRDAGPCRPEAAIAVVRRWRLPAGGGCHRLPCAARRAVCRRPARPRGGRRGGRGLLRRAARQGHRSAGDGRGRPRRAGVSRPSRAGPRHRLPARGLEGPWRALRHRLRRLGHLQLSRVPAAARSGRYLCAHAVECGPVRLVLVAQAHGEGALRAGDGAPRPRRPRNTGALGSGGTDPLGRDPHRPAARKTSRPCSAPWKAATTAARSSCASRRIPEPLADPFGAAAGCRSDWRPPLDVGKENGARSAILDRYRTEIFENHFRWDGTSSPAGDSWAASPQWPSWPLRRSGLPNRR